MLDKTSEDASWTPAMEVQIRNLLDPSLTSDEIAAAIQTIRQLFRETSGSRFVLVDTEARREALVREVLRVAGPWADYYAPETLLQAIVDIELTHAPENEWTFDVLLLAALNPSIDEKILFDSDDLLLFMNSVNSTSFLAIFALHNPLSAEVLARRFELFLKKLLGLDKQWFRRFFLRLVLEEHPNPYWKTSPDQGKEFPNPDYRPDLLAAMRKTPKAFREAIWKSIEGLDLPDIRRLQENWGAIRRRKAFPIKMSATSSATRSMTELLWDHETALRDNEMEKAVDTMLGALDDLFKVASLSLGATEATLLCKRILAAFLVRHKAPPYGFVLDRVL